MDDVDVEEKGKKYKTFVIVLSMLLARDMDNIVSNCFCRMFGCLAIFPKMPTIYPRSLSSCGQMFVRVMLSSYDI